MGGVGSIYLEVQIVVVNKLVCESNNLSSIVGRRAGDCSMPCTQRLATFKCVCFCQRSHNSFVFVRLAEFVNEPSEAERGNIVDIGTLCDWAGLLEDATDGESPKASFLKLLGAKANVYYRVLANIPVNDFDAVLAKWQINGGLPPAALLSQGGLVGRTARVLYGVELSMAKKRKLDTQLQKDLLNAKAAAQTAVNYSNAAASISAKPNTNLGSVLNNVVSNVNPGTTSSASLGVVSISIWDMQVMLPRMRL